MRTGTLRSTALLPLVAFCPVVRAQQVSNTVPDTDSVEPLELLVAEYLREPAAKARAQILRRIETASGDDVSAVTRALRSARLWKTPESLAGEMLTPDSGPVRALAYLLPDEYDPDRSYPVLLLWTRSSNAPRALRALRVKTGDTLKGFVLVCPRIDADLGDGFKAQEPANLATLLREVRTRFHVDSDRVFLIGESSGSPMAWSMVLGRPEVLAGALFVASAPDLPYPAQSYPLLLPNLSGLDVLLVWGSSNRAEAEPSSAGPYCEAILALARERSLPISGIRLASTQDPWDEFDIWSDRFAALVARRREPIPRAFTHRFRYPHQGRRSWIKQTASRGDIWMADEQLSIRTDSDANRGRFVREVFESRLGLIAGRFAGDALAIETRRCGRLELMWPLAWLREIRPLKVTCNGKARHVAAFTPSVGALLESARDTWDFQRLFVATISLSVKAEPLPRQRRP